MQDADGRRVRIVDTLEAARLLFGPVLGRARDGRLYMAHLTADSRLIGLRLRYAPPDSPVEFPVRKIIADALALGTHSLILAHNHPSGDPEPSATDLETTRSLVQIARPLGLTVRDHLIFGGGRVTSLRALGLL